MAWVEARPPAKRGALLHMPHNITRAAYVSCYAVLFGQTQIRRREPTQQIIMRHTTKKLRNNYHTRHVFDIVRNRGAHTAANASFLHHSAEISNECSRNHLLPTTIILYNKTFLVQPRHAEHHTQQIFFLTHRIRATQESNLYMLTLQVR